jgi:membrane fusion protein, multidrug efflux system
MPDASSTDPSAQPGRPAAPPAGTSPAEGVAPDHPRPPSGRNARLRRWGMWAVGGLAALVVLVEGIPWLITALTTVSTDDAFVNGHVTFVAARIPGQVERVLVDDNNRVRKGDLLVQLDREPYQVKVDIAGAAVAAAQADLIATRSDVRGKEALARSLRFDLAHAVEGVDNQIALLRSRVATLQGKRATLARAQADFDRERPLANEGAVSKQELDRYREVLSVAQAQVASAEQEVYEIRAALGLPPPARSGDEHLAEVPADLDQTFSGVKEAQDRLMQTAAELGVVYSFDLSPQQMLTEFYRRAPEGNIDRIFAQILKDAPAVKQAEAKVAEAQRRLEQAKLELRYCDIIAEIDGVVTRRSVNPGNNVVAGQSLMAIRSLTDIWIDANFKETQLAKLRIGQPADIDVDMYGSHQRFKGRISGFTMGTGATLALLPAENATGNFVKVVQRLPVRIELLDYDPDKAPLFFGLSVTPYVHVNAPPTGPDAGKVLQPYRPPTADAASPAAP